MKCLLISLFIISNLAFVKPVKKPVYTILDSGYKDKDKLTKVRQNYLNKHTTPNPNDRHNKVVHID